MPRLEVALLGLPQIQIDGDLVKTDRRKAIALLAYLAVMDNPHPRDFLATLLWPDYERKSAYAYLRRTLWELNQILGKGFIITDREYVALDQKHVWLDTTVFQELVSSATDGVSALIDAVALYRGDFLAGLTIVDAAPFEDWQFQQAEIYRRQFSGVLQRLANTYVQVGEYTTALEFARRWHALDPLNETAHRAIMRVLAGMGDRSSAIRQYEVCAQILQTELDIPPQTETTELYEAILREDFRVSQVDQALPTTYAQSKPALHLPVPPTPFIERVPEIEQVKSLLLSPDYRLLTLTGPGGAGKTRLAIRVVPDVMNTFPDGVVFVTLAPLQSAEGMISAIAKALTFSFIREQESLRQQLLDYLRGKRLLLILDNFEHLIGDGARKLVMEILVAAQGVSLMVTSRVRLNMQGEQIFRVAGMRTPDPKEIAAWKDIETEVESFNAVHLFVDRARSVQPGFTLVQENLQDIAEICRLVDGLPLGLELAAAWLELLPPAEIAAEIARSLDFLEVDQADLPERQRSIRAVFESSWKMLTENEREAFQRLSVFVGSFSREAAQQVGGTSLRTLLGLVNKSWLQQTDNGRFQLHEFLRQYGLEQLQGNETDWQAAKDDHAAFYTAFIEDQGEELRGLGQKSALDAISLEFGSNLNTAWNWLVVRGQFETLVEKFLPALYHFCEIRWILRDIILLVKPAREKLEARMAGEAERSQKVQFAVLAAIETNLELWSRIWTDDPQKRFLKIWDYVKENTLEKEMGMWYLLLARRYGWSVDFDQGLEYQKQAISLIRVGGDSWALGYALCWMGGALVDGFKFAEGEPCLVEAMEIFRKFGACWEQAEVLSFLGDTVLNRDGDLDEYNRLKQAAQEMYERIGDQYGVGCLWQGFAVSYSRRGEHTRAFEAFHKQRAIYEALGNRRVLGDCLHMESQAASKYSTLEHALDTRQQSLDIATEIGDSYQFAWRAWEMGEIHRIAGDIPQARIWYEKASTLFKKLQVNLGKAMYQRGYGDIALAEGKLDEAREWFQRYYHIAELQRPPHIWSLAYAQAKLGWISAVQGNFENAQKMIRNAIEGVQSWSILEIGLLALFSQATLFATSGEVGHALELAAFIAQHPVSWNETKKQAKNLIETTSFELPEEVVAIALERGRELDFDSAVEEFIETQ